MRLLVIAASTEQPQTASLTSILRWSYKAALPGSLGSRCRTGRYSGVVDYLEKACGAHRRRILRDFGVIVVSIVINVATAIVWEINVFLARRLLVALLTAVGQTGGGAFNTMTEGDAIPVLGV